MPKVNPFTFIRGGVTEGISANQAYRNMQDEARRASEETGLRWTGIRRTTFLQMYSGTRQARSNVVDAMNAPKDVPGGGLSIPSRPATVPSGYLNWGVSHTRQIGTSEVEMSFHPFRTAEPLTPSEVEDRIRAQIEESAADTHGTFNRYTILSITYTGVEQLIREGVA